jgi:hypothetical protein
MLISHGINVISEVLSLTHRRIFVQADVVARPPEQTRRKAGGKALVFLSEILESEDALISQERIVDENPSHNGQRRVSG